MKPLRANEYEALKTKWRAFDMGNICVFRLITPFTASSRTYWTANVILTFIQQMQRLIITQNLLNQTFLRSSIEKSVFPKIIYLILEAEDILVSLSFKHIQFNQIFYCSALIRKHRNNYSDTFTVKFM